jgi:hypothetical protein
MVDSRGPLHIGRQAHRAIGTFLPLAIGKQHEVICDDGDRQHESTKFGAQPIGKGGLSGRSWRDLGWQRDGESGRLRDNKD